MKTQSAKAKGRRLQQATASDIRDDYELPEEDVRSTSMGAGGIDIQMSSRAMELFPLSIEAKNQESLNIWKALEQAIANCAENTTPAVVFKRNRSETFIALPWNSFRTLMKQRKI